MNNIRYFFILAFILFILKGPACGYLIWGKIYLRLFMPTATGIFVLVLNDY